MKLHRSIYYLSALVMASTLSLATAQTSSAPPARHDLPWDQRSYEDRLYNGRYEDRYTYKHKKPYTYDPWTWGYTKEFAERFHMPEQWIEPDLKGALAVAFRMTVIDVITQCGIGGKEDNCWTPKAECQLDVYYDSRISLPWNYPEVMRDNLMGGLHSGQYLHDPTFRSRGVNRHFYGRRDANDPEKDKPVGAINAGGNFRHGRYSTGGSVLVLFDREYQSGIGLISWIGNGVCPEYSGPEQVYMRFENADDIRKSSRGSIKESEVRTVHRVDFPVTYLQRAKAVYDAQKGASDEAINRLIKGFFESRKAAPKVP